MAGKTTPVMQQYLDIKREHEDALLFFRMGDFYEMFFEDAERAASLLDITLTSRNRNDPEPIPMCGVPFHSVKPYVAKLLEAGVKVALCEQIELPTKGIAKREVTRIVTPGTSLDEETLAPERANYLAAVAPADGSSGWGLAWADFSTGEQRMTELASLEALENELGGIAPAEIVLASGEGAAQLTERLEALLPGVMVTPADASLGAAAESHAAGSAANAADRASSCLRAYLDRTQGGRTEHLRDAAAYDAGAFVALDAATLRNLEIVESVDGRRAGSLLGALDRAVSPMGRRLMRQWLVKPLADPAAIGERLDAVERLFEDVSLRGLLRETLREVGDLERLGGRIGSRMAGARDLLRLQSALSGADTIASMLREAGVQGRLEHLGGALAGLPALRALIERAIDPEPAAAPGKGAIIRHGYHEEIDRLRAVSRDGKGWMASFAEREKERTGISNLKIGYNKVFGYYIEVSKSAKDKVPEDYEGKQTLANAERYITPDLKTAEAEVLGAEERLVSLETHLLQELVAEAAAELATVAATATALAEIDVYTGAAETAHVCDHVRPEMTRDGTLELVDARHPVVEAALGSGFIPNDCRLAPDETTVMVITGPNMAGKSTYLRQTALVCLMAHCGMFVPASSARVALLDRIFTRIGASDNLARGQSTFMVEMTETAGILSNMTDKSLVVLDEIGRGTSTFDGISIAWAVAEAMVGAGAKTLFATHYHELAGLAAEYERVANHSVAVRRYKGDIVFLYRVVEGAASGSYGIEVAKLAGLPEGVVQAAREMLAKFESGEGPSAADAPDQPGLFDPRAKAWESELVGRLSEVNVETMTPIDALALLDRLVQEARKGA